MSDYCAWVDPRQGTDSTMAFSHGNTLPAVATPFAMNTWALETLQTTGQESSWFYSPHHRTSRGIRCSHQASPWMDDYGCFRILPQSGTPDLSDGGLSSSFSPEGAVFAPSFFEAVFHRFGARLSLAPTQRGAVVEVRFPPTSRRRLVVRTVRGDARFDLAPDGHTLLATFRTPGPGVRDNLGFHLALRSSVPVDDLVRFGAAGEDVNESGGDTAHAEAYGTMRRPLCGAALELARSSRRGEPGHATPADEPITFHLATSWIGLEQALVTLDREIAPLDLRSAEAAARAAWNERLGRIRVSTRDDETRRTFTSCLFRAQLYPNRTDEVDSDGRTVHRSFYDGGVHPGPMVTNNGFWDTYRTVYPLLGLVYPQTLGTILNGWVSASREGAWTPKWPAPGHRGTMIGTHLDAVFADAYTKGIAGWDASEAYECARRNAFDVAPDGAPYGRVGLEHYLRLGYVPEDLVEHAASRTLDFVYGDFCLAQMASGLGREEDAARLAERAGWWRNIYDTNTGFLRGRRSDGSFSGDFDPYLWGGPYVEGSAWQCGFAVYHEPLSLGDLLAGSQDERAAARALERHLDALFNAPARFDSGHYPTEIHEMSEMAAVDFGQYAHSNQPSHHIPFLYTWTDSTWKADHVVRSVLEQLYDSSPAGFCGDEDNGEMSSWYVLASLGLYQVCPGRPEYRLTAPLFEEAVVEAEGREPLRITARGSSTNARYAGTIRIDGRPIDGRSVSHARLLDAREIDFETRRMPV